MSGETECPHILCRHHLVGEIARRPESEAIEAMQARLRGDVVATCALDVADTHENGIEDTEIAKIIGVDASRVTQISAEANARLRKWLPPITEGGPVKCERCGGTNDVDEFLAPPDYTSWRTLCQDCNQ